MLNCQDLINKVKDYNKFLNPEKLNKAYDFAEDPRIVISNLHGVGFKFEIPE